MRQLTRRSLLVATTVAFPRLAFAADCRTISGRVVWEGQLPKVPPFRAMASPLVENKDRKLRDWANPMAPRIDSAGMGLAGVLVRLAGVAGKPASMGPIRVEALDGQIVLMQGGEARQAGVARVGDSVEFVSRQARHQVVRARGAAFWAVPMPERDKPTRRVCEKAGWVELSSAAGQYWARAHLLVTDDAFVTWTDAQGRFRFEGVPAGKATVLARVPDWRLERFDRDPETTEPARADYRAAKDFEAPADGVSEVVLKVPAAAFAGR